MADSLPPISLAIGGGKAWDDRELVNAYDAALLEFHIHNPGPGSWLDKATAALAKGQPLPGATDFGTAWYSASKPEEEEEEPEEPPKKKAKKTKQKNPYASTGKPAADAAPSSPTYQPVSPGGYDTVEWPPTEENEEEVEDDDEGNGDEWQGYDGYGGADDAGHVFPAPARQWPGGNPVGRDEAIGYALHAQYWAGYWMGIAAAGRSSNGEATESTGAAAPRGKSRASQCDLRR